MHRHVPTITKVQKPVEVTVIETIEKIVDVPVVKQVEVPQIQTIEKIVEVPYIQTVEKIVEIPQMGDTVQGNQRSVTQQLETMRQTAPAETVQEVVEGPPMPMESMTPVLKVGGSEVGTGSQMVYGAPGTMNMQVGGSELGT